MSLAMTRVNPGERPSNSIAQDTIPGLSIGSKNAAPWKQWAHDLMAREEWGEPAAEAKRDMWRKARRSNCWPNLSLKTTAAGQPGACGLSPNVRLLKTEWTALASRERGRLALRFAQIT